MTAMVHTMAAEAAMPVAAEAAISVAAAAAVAGTASSPAAPTLLAVLREGTRASHERIEAAPALACLMSPSLSVAAYVHALRGLQAMHAGVAAQLAVLPAGAGAVCAPDDGALRRLAEDLAWFGARPRRRLALRGAIPDRLAALGALYVVEGSALGARVIGRAVSQSLGVAPGRGGSFFCAATADAARSRWLAVAGFLTASGTGLDAGGQARVVAGANAVFDALAGALQPVARPASPRRSRAAGTPLHSSAAQPLSSVPAASGRALI